MQATLLLLLEYKYAILFPLAIVEGPIVSILAGFLISAHSMNFVLAFLVVMAGDVIGDTMYYSLGRWGEAFIRRHGFRIGITEKRLDQTKQFFEENHHKAVFISKVAHGIGFTGLIVAGILKIRYSKFIRTCFLVTLVQACLLLVIGILFGHAYNAIEKYLNYYAAGATVAVLVVFAIVAINKIKNSELFK